MGSLVTSRQQQRQRHCRGYGKQTGRQFAPTKGDKWRRPHSLARSLHNCSVFGRAVGGRAAFECEPQSVVRV